MQHVHLNLVLVDDDEGARGAVARLLKVLGHTVRTFDSAEAFEADPVDADCLIIDVRLTGLSGPELRDRLRRRGDLTPVVFITGDSGIKGRDAGSTGGTATVMKPFDDVTLMAAIRLAVSSADSAGDNHAG